MIRVPQPETGRNVKRFGESAFSVCAAALISADFKQQCAQPSLRDISMSAFVPDDCFGEAGNGNRRLNDSQTGQVGNQPARHHSDQIAHPQHVGQDQKAGNREHNAAATAKRFKRAIGGAAKATSGVRDQRMIEFAKTVERKRTVCDGLMIGSQNADVLFVEESPRM